VKRTCACFVLFDYICSAVDDLIIKNRLLYSIYRLSPSHFSPFRFVDFGEIDHDRSLRRTWGYQRGNQHCKSKNNRQHNGQKRKNKQQSTKHHTES